jgi:hypothetical protein
MKSANHLIQASETHYMQLAIDTIRLNAITNSVKAVRANMEQVKVQPAQAVVRTMTPYKMALRIAAVVIIMISSATIYKYASVNTQSLYNREFAGYDLGTTRGANAQDALTDAYRNMHWKQVVAIQSAETIQTNKSRFLAGMAEMQLKRFPEAVMLFKGVLKYSDDESFRDEAEYYLALAHLAGQEKSEGLQMLAKIKASPSHTYYPLVARIPVIDLKIIELKKN